jgi:hypothetical protein
MYSPVINWYESLIWVAWSILGMVISAAVVIFILLILPHDYFHSRRRSAFVEDQPFFFRWLMIVFKNLLGIILIAAGMILSLPGIPGQGLLTILIGLILVDIPGKGFLQDKLITTPAVINPINKLRARFGKPPITSAVD